MQQQYRKEQREKRKGEGARKRERESGREGGRESASIEGEGWGASVKQQEHSQTANWSQAAARGRFITLGITESGSTAPRTTSYGQHGSCVH